MESLSLDCVDCGKRIETQRLLLRRETQRYGKVDHAGNPDCEGFYFGPIGTPTIAGPTTCLACSVAASMTQEPLYGPPEPITLRTFRGTLTRRSSAPEPIYGPPAPAPVFPSVDTGLYAWSAVTTPGGYARQRENDRPARDRGSSYIGCHVFGKPDAIAREHGTRFTLPSLKSQASPTLNREASGTF